MSTDRTPVSHSTTPLPLEVSDGCSLRLFEDSDAPALYALIDANRDYLGRWLPWARGETEADALAFIRTAELQRTGNDGFQAAIVIDGALAGSIGFHRVDWAHRSTSIGYWIAADRQGSGAVTAAVRALLGHAFAVWNLNRVEVRVAPANAPSRAVVRRVGFREEGTLREAERLGEDYLDNVVFSLLASEWHPG